MDSWIPVNTSEINELRVVSLHGVNVNVYLSPYDVPRGIRGYFDREADRFAIEFQYIVKEPTKKLDGKDGVVTVYVGKNSGRLYRILINVNKIKVDHVALEVRVSELVSEKISELKKKMQKRKENYDVAGRVIQETQEKLLEELAAV